jgi:poly-gamma-glutamate system protein
MTRMNLNIRLLIAFGILLTGTIISESFFRIQQPLEYISSMKESVNLTKKWFSVIELFKREKGITSDALSNVPFSFMIGNEWSEITTTLGSLEAKEISTNPDFSALLVRLLHEAGITKDKKVGVILSGSFPSLSISLLAALQTMEIDGIVMSSVGASTYGANQPDATWIDMESVLRDLGGLRYKSNLVSIGAGNDSGAGLSEDGLIKIRNAASRNKIDLFIPASLKESIEKHVQICKDQKISILINIGGNQTALGDCPHSLSIPNGLQTKYKSCSDENCGLIMRMSELGVPFINMLNIKDLAVQYGIDVSPGISYSGSSNLYSETNTNKPVLGLVLAIGLIPIYFLRKNIMMT